MWDMYSCFSNLLQGHHLQPSAVWDQILGWCIKIKGMLPRCISERPGFRHREKSFMWVIKCLYIIPKHKTAWYSLHLDTACILRLSIFLREPSLISSKAGDQQHHRALFVNKGKLRQGTGRPTMAERAAEEERSAHWKAHPRLWFPEKSSLLSACKQCSVWGNREVRRKDAQKQSTAFSASALRKMTNTLFYKASVLSIF